MAFGSMCSHNDFINDLKEEKAEEEVKELINEVTALSFKIWSHCREMCYFIARAVRTEMSFSL